MRRALPLLLCLSIISAGDEPSPSAFRLGEDPRVRIAIDGKEIRPGNPTARVLRDLLAYWFAWCAYYPRGTVYAPKK